MTRGREREKSMHSSLLRLPPLFSSNSIPLSLHGETSISARSPTNPLWNPLRPSRWKAITMRDRSKNRKPTQRGRYLSVEAIQAVQALKRSKINGGDSVDRTMESKIRRLVKSDLVAVLRELLSQGEGILALQVFEEVRGEHWYKPQLSVYVDMITVLASNGLKEKVEQVCSYLKMESLQPDTKGFNLLLRTLLKFGFNYDVMDCFRLMKLWESDPDESTFRILITGLESNGEMDLSLAVRQEAEKCFGGHLEFLEKEEVFSDA